MEITAIEEGEIITAPGVYRMAMAWYHSACTDGPSVSSTGLRTIENECPAQFWAFSYLNPNAYPMEEKAAFSFGRAAHCLILGDEVWSEHYAVRPREWTDWRKSAAKEWRDQQIEAGRTVVTEADLTHITCMANELSRHPLAASLVEGVIEPSLIWQDAETGIWCKARPDVLPMSGVISDFKTIGRKASPFHCCRAITEHAYHQQLALIAEGMAVIFGEGPTNGVLIFQQTAAPYHVTPIEVSPEALAVGRDQNRRALRRMARCLETGEWPSYTDTIPTYYLPDAKMKALDESGLGADAPSEADSMEFAP